MTGAARCWSNRPSEKVCCCTMLRAATMSSSSEMLPRRSASCRSGSSSQRGRKRTSTTSHERSLRCGGRHRRSPCTPPRSSTALPATAPGRDRLLLRHSHPHKMSSCGASTRPIFSRSTTKPSPAYPRRPATTGVTRQCRLTATITGSRRTGTAPTLSGRGRPTTPRHPDRRRGLDAKRARARTLSTPALPPRRLTHTCPCTPPRSR